RDVREQLDDVGDGPTDAARRELGEEDRRADGDRRGEHDRDQGGDDGPVDVRGRPEDEMDGIPHGRGEVREAEGGERRPCVDDDEERDAGQRERYEHRQHRHAGREGPVAALRRAPGYCDGSTLRPALVTDRRTSSAVFTTFAGSGAYPRSFVNA